MTCLQISQEAGQVVWDSLLFKNFSQFVVIHTVKGFGIVYKAEVHVFLELSCFFDDPSEEGNGKPLQYFLMIRVKKEMANHFSFLAFVTP